jgi:exonuclease III
LFQEPILEPLTQPAPPPPCQETIIATFKQLFNYSNQPSGLRYHQPDRQEAKLLTANLADNFPWGHDLLLPKPVHCFRTYYQNVNGTKLDTQGENLSSFLSTFDELNCDLVGLCETKLDVSKYTVKKIINQTIKTKFRSSCYASSTSKIPFDTDYKPGGTMTLCFGHCVSRFHSKFEDPLGRWCTLSLNARNGLVIHFITLYQVVNKTQNGPFTAFQQQRTSLLLEGRDIPPRKAFLQDFDAYLLSLKPTQSQYVVMGDFNEVVGKTLSGFAAITGRYQLVDILGHFHTLEREVPTYARGTKRLDYVFCSSSLLPTVAQCGAEPFNQHIFSDHRALFVDWHEEILFGSKQLPMVGNTQCCLQAKSRPAQAKYIEELHDYCKVHNVFQRLSDLHEKPNSSKAEAIDRDITRGMLTAEKRCRHPGPDPWSPILQEARLLVEIFRHALSMVGIGLECRFKLGRLLAKYAKPIDIPDSSKGLSKSLRSAQQHLRHIQKEAADARRSH